MFAIYVHWPFCESKCPYCDFNSHVGDEIDHARWQRAFDSQLTRHATETGSREVTSIFFGGGTPSLMPPKMIAAVIDGIAARWAMANDVEITAEANPGSAEVKRFKAFREAGVNRISIGVQSLNDTALRSLGRVHNSRQARAAVDAAARIMPRYSFDLIYARPGQTVTDWHDELTGALDITGEHLSIYQLTIEPGTEFHRQGITAARENIAAELYEVTQEQMTAAGLPAYEISNHARPGAECRHNLVYWLGHDYLSIGPGGHGRLTTNQGVERCQEIRDPAKWLTAVEKSGSGTQVRAVLTAGERRDELIIMGLRLSNGIEVGRFEAAAGRSIYEALDMDRVAELCGAGFLRYDGDRLAATPDGRQRLNAVLERLLA